MQESSNNQTGASERLTLEQVIWECANNKEFVKEYDRLRGANVSLKRGTIYNEIDKVSGKWEADVKAFFDFCVDAVWDRLPVEVRIL